MSSIPRMEFPRPDFQRELWQSLNGQWEFCFDDSNELEKSGEYFSKAFDKEITVPFCCQSKSSGIGIEEDHPVVWYRKSFKPEGLSSEGRQLIKFGAVDHIAKVWLNGVYLGTHTGGYTPFEFDVTGLMDFSKENILVLKAEDYPMSSTPRGKQTWTGEKFGCWYTPVTGIWQSVWLESVGTAYLKKLKITPDINTLTAQCELFVSTPLEVEAEVQVYGQIDGKDYDFGSCRVVCREGYGRAVIGFEDFDLRREQLFWAPEHPRLIDVSVTVKGETADKVTGYFGMRSIGRAGDTLLLNGNPYFQRLVLDQGYWTESILTPPSDEAIKEDIILTKKMGFNGARKHQKLEDPRYYYWADKLGLLVWGELPSAYAFNDNAILGSVHTLEEFVERDYNHPSIVLWVPINESWGVRDILTSCKEQDYSRMLYYTLKTLDSTRFISINDGWEQTSETDICAIHDYSLFPDTAKKYDNMEKILASYAEGRILFAEGSEYKGQPVLLTEYGGIAFAKENDDGWGYYGKVKDEEEFFQRLAPITDYLLHSGHFSGFCYTQLTDVMQEVNGLLGEDRKPKVSVERLASVFGARK